MREKTFQLFFYDQISWEVFLQGVFVRRGGQVMCPDTIRRLITQNIATAVLMCILNEIQTARKLKVQIFAIMQNIGTTVLLYELNEMKAALETKAQVFAI